MPTTGDHAPLPPIFRVDLHEVGSTNDEVRCRGSDIPQNGFLLVTARRQTRGRGRLGRAWESPEGGAWLTLARPIGRPDAAGPLGLVVAAAVAEAVEGLVGSPVSVRWPNDVLIGDLKVGGLLGETWDEGGRRVLGLGIGVNGNNPVPEVGLRTAATSVSRAAGGPVDLGGLIDAIVTHTALAWLRFEATGFDDQTRARVTCRLAQLGRAVSVGPARGVLIGLDTDAALVLDTGEGLIRVR